MSISYAVFCLTRLPPRSPLFPYTTLFRSMRSGMKFFVASRMRPRAIVRCGICTSTRRAATVIATTPATTPIITTPSTTSASGATAPVDTKRSEEHTSELQSHVNLVCRLLLDTSTTEISPLSLHDALPIYAQRDEVLRRLAHAAAGHRALRDLHEHAPRRDRDRDDARHHADHHDAEHHQRQRRHRARRHEEIGRAHV